MELDSDFQLYWAALCLSASSKMTNSSSKARTQFSERRTRCPGCCWQSVSAIVSKQHAPTLCSKPIACRSY